jgi:hypothetical protein
MKSNVAQLGSSRIASGPRTSYCRPPADKLKRGFEPLFFEGKYWQLHGTKRRSALNSTTSPVAQHLPLS